MLETEEYWGTLAQLASSIISKKSTYEDLWEHMFVKGTSYQYLTLHHSHNSSAIADSIELIPTSPPGGWYETLKQICFYAVREDIKDMIRRRGLDPDNF